MFELLCKNLSFVVRTSRIQHHELYFLQNPSALSSLRHISRSIQSIHSFTVSYLINSCGLSPESALSASKLVQFETSEKPDSVISLFKNSGFSEAQISDMVKRNPKLLLLKPEKNLSPKLEFFFSKGLSSSYIFKIMSSCPLLWHGNLNSYIVPSFNYLRDLLRCDKKAVAAMRNVPFLLKRDLERVAAPKINFLLENGVPEVSIVRLVHRCPGILYMNLNGVQRALEEVRKMGFHPSQSQFVVAVGAVIGMTISTWEKKIDTYMKCGWSEEEILAAFRSQPSIMKLSEDKIMGVMDLFVDKLGWKPALIAKRGFLFTYSLEKRLIPRASILQFLVTKGLVKKDVRATTIFVCSETIFLQRFVNCYDEASEILRLYNEKLAHLS